MNQTVAKRMFPDLADQIMPMFKLYRTEAKRTSEQFRKIAVESAINQLLHEGRTLSYNLLGRVLAPGFSARDLLVRAKFKRYRQQAEQEMQSVIQE